MCWKLSTAGVLNFYWHSHAEMLIFCPHFLFFYVQQLDLDDSFTVLQYFAHTCFGPKKCWSITNKLTIPLNSNHSLHFLDFIMTQHVTKRSPYDRPLTGENLLKDDAAKTVQALRKYKKGHFNMFWLKMMITMIFIFILTKPNVYDTKQFRKPEEKTKSFLGGTEMTLHRYCWYRKCLGYKIRFGRCSDLVID